MRTLEIRNVHVPEDLSIVGFNDIPIAAAYNPPLTTISYPAANAGRLAAMMLTDTLAPEMALTMKLVPQLMERKTVKPLL